MISNIARTDYKWSQSLWAADYGKPYNYIFYLLSVIFMEETAFVAIISTFFILERNLSLYVLYLITFVANIVVTLVTKKLWKRPRPTTKDFPQSSKSLFFRNKQSNCSLPSGDTLQAVNLAWFLIMYGPSWSAVVFASLGLMVGYSRVYLCCHYITDCIVGGLLGIGTSLFLTKAIGLEAVNFGVYLSTLL